MFRLDYLSLQFSLWHWSVFVKEWRNEVRVDGHQEKRDEDDETPEVDKEVVAAPVDNLDHSSQDWGLDCLRHHKLLHLVDGEEASSLLVEPVVLLHHKGAVDCEGEGGDGGEDRQVEGKQERGKDLTVSRVLDMNSDMFITSEKDHLPKSIKGIQGPPPEYPVAQHPE